MKQLFLSWVLLSACGPTNTTITQFNPSRYGAITIRINPSNITQAELGRINTGLERAKALGPNFTAVTTVPDVELSKDDAPGRCNVSIERATRNIRIAASCFTDAAEHPSIEAMVTKALATWVGNQTVCRENQVINPANGCQPCSTVGRGIALSNSSCVFDNGDSFDDGTLQIMQDAGTPSIIQSNEVTQLDLDEYRRVHP